MAKGNAVDIQAQRGLPVSATDFAGQLSAALRGREQVCRIQLGTGVPTELAQEWLEQHARDYCINKLLAALNWSIAGYYDVEQYRRANMGVEVSLSRDRTRTF